MQFAVAHMIDEKYCNKNLKAGLNHNKKDFKC